VRAQARCARDLAWAAPVRPDAGRTPDHDGGKDAARRLGDEPFLLYGADSYLDRRSAPADPDDLTDHEVVVYAGRHPAAEWCARAFARAMVALSAPSMQVTGAAIAGGLGLGVLPKRAARLFPALRPLSPVVAKGTGWLIVHPDLRHVPRMRVVVDTLAAAYRADPTTLG